MGSEQKGLSEEHLAICDQTVNLPMMGKSEFVEFGGGGGGDVV